MSVRLGFVVFDNFKRFVIIADTRSVTTANVGGVILVLTFSWLMHTQLVDLLSK